jgi:hypothetical protein
MSMTTSWRRAAHDPGPKADPRRIQAAAALRAELENVSSPDDEFSQHITVAIALLHSGLPDLSGPASGPAPARPGSLPGPARTS